MGGTIKLYFGDNLNILRDYVEDATVDLIYLDPPFNSSATYYRAFVAPPFRAALAGLKPGATASGEESAAQIAAFEVSVAPLYERRLLHESKTTGGHRPPLQGSNASALVYKETVTSAPRRFARGHGASPRDFRGRFAVPVRRRAGA